jgi:carboxymethylenebutenolidase
MRNQLIIVGVLIIIAIAGLIAYQRFAPAQTDRNTDPPTVTNSDMLDSGNQREISTESNVGYFSGAKGYFARPKDSENYPGVVMIHENRGLRPEIRDTADQLAKEGFLVLAVDLFDGKVVESQEEARALTSGFDQDTGTQNLRAAVNYLKQKGGATKIASLGWCFGGRQSIELAISGEPLYATVVYYGGNMASTTDKLAPIKWPVLGIFGDKDQAIPVSKVKEFESSLNTLGVENEIHIYPGVGHAFANPSGQNYAPRETKDAWAKTLNFLNKNLKT